MNLRDQEPRGEAGATDDQSANPDGSLSCRITTRAARVNLPCDDKRAALGLAGRRMVG